MTIRKAVATTTTMAIKGGEKSMGYLDGGDDAWSEVVMKRVERVGAGAGDGDATTIFMSISTVAEEESLAAEAVVGVLKSGKREREREWGKVEGRGVNAFG